jgi:hypothetical protein
MGLSDWLVKAGTFATMGGALIALGGLAVTTCQAQSTAREKATLEWQEVVVFSTIQQAGTEGLQFERIKAAYLDQVADLPEALPREEIKTQALKRVLLLLIANHAIVIRTGGNYAVNVDTSAMIIDQLETAARLQPMGDAIIKTLAESPNVYTSNELRDVLHADEADFGKLIRQMMTSGAVKADAHGKLRPGFVPR